MKTSRPKDSRVIPPPGLQTCVRPRTTLNCDLLNFHGLAPSTNWHQNRFKSGNGRTNRPGENVTHKKTVEIGMSSKHYSSHSLPAAQDHGTETRDRAGRQTAIVNVVSLTLLTHRTS